MNIKSKNTQEVMKKEWLYAVGLVCLVSACTGTPQSSADDELCSIDVAGAMEKPAELKLSELGSDVTLCSIRNNRFVSGRWKPEYSVTG